MKRNSIFKTLFSAMTLVAVASCSDWTDVESIKLNTPTIEEQNPELYAQYVKSLNEFKTSEHQVVITSIDNVSTIPTSRSQHLTDMPDSIDYICLNNIMEVSEVNASEMEEVRRLGTKVLGLVDFDKIESAWKKSLMRKLPMYKLFPMKQRMREKKNLLIMQHALLNTVRMKWLNKLQQAVLWE